MEKIIYLAVHLIIPLVILFSTIFLIPRSKTGLIVKSALNFSVIGFLCLWGQWAIAGSYYLRFFMIIIMLLIVVFGIFRYQKGLAWRPAKTYIYFLSGFKTLLAVAFFFLTIQTYKGLYYPDPGIDLVFPLKEGTFYIASGGSNKLANNHFRNYPNDQQFALDINKLGNLKGICSGIMSSEITAHHIFADTVFCPCNGTVTEMERSVPDNVTSGMHVDPDKGRGNFITLNCNGIIVSMAHLKELSILISKGSRVEEGEPLGQVGNSGFSQEPHLHIQASVYNPDSVLVGIPMQFNGRHFSKNDLISR